MSIIDPDASGKLERELNLSAAQRSFIHQRELEFGNAAVDYEMTVSMRKVEANAHDWVAVISMLPGAEVKIYLIDTGGAVVMEGGAGKELG